MARHRGLVFLLGIALFFSCEHAAFSQASISVARLNGTVRDETGAAVVNASITLRETDTNRPYTVTTNESGFYVIPSLPPGHYELTAASAGFGKYIQTGIVLTVGQTASIDVALKVQSQTEQVSVSGEAAPVEPTRTEVSQVIGTSEIASLPISGRQFTDFALLTPGVAVGRTSTQSTFTEFEIIRVSFGGMRDFSNLVTVDGADTINTVTNTQRATPPQEAVNEFRVVNNSFGTEYGRALGGIVNVVTKSGTNETHGSIYDYFQNNATDANYLLAVPGHNILRQNQFGATLGGAIRKDKSFFFTNYEGQRREQSPQLPAVLVDNINTINLAKSYLGLAPENIYALKTNDHDNGIIKLDNQINDDNRLSLRYSVLDVRAFNVLVGNTMDGGGIAAPSSGRNNFIRDQSLVGTLTSTPKSGPVNSFLMQYARRHYDYPGTTGEPNLDIPNLLLFGHNFGTFDSVSESRAQESDTLAWVKGKHVAQFGVDANQVWDQTVWAGFTPMRIIMPGLDCLQDFANYVDIPGAAPIATFNGEGPCGPLGSGAPIPTEVLHGVPAIFWGAPIGSEPITPGTPACNFTTSTGTNCDLNNAPLSLSWKTAYNTSLAHDFTAPWYHGYYGFYAEDQWRITSKLTLNYGVRWDFETGLNQYFYGTDYKAIAPRVGIAYSPNPHTVIRSGYGLFFDRYNLTFDFVARNFRGLQIPGFSTPGFRKGSENETYALSQEVAGPLTPPGQPSSDAKTLVTTGVLPDTWLPSAGNAPNQLVTASLSIADPKSRTPYSEQASLEIDHEFGKGFTVGAGYLFVGAHRTVRPQDLNICPPSGVAPYNFPNGCAPAPIAAFPSRQTFSGLRFNAGLGYYTANDGNSVYHGGSLQVTEKAGKYFQLHANYTFSHTLDDGTFNTFVSTPQNEYDRALERARSVQDVRHRFIANFVANAPDRTVFRNIELSGIVTVQTPRPFTLFDGFDANGDTNPVTDRPGPINGPTVGRNTYLGDKLCTVDMRLGYTFHFKPERLRLQLFAEAFNLFNRQNVDEVYTVYGWPYFQAGPGGPPLPQPVRYKDGIGSAFNPNFGQPRNTFNPRQLQFTAKLRF